jgi:hypothetical protein
LARLGSVPGLRWLHSSDRLLDSLGARFPNLAALGAVYLHTPGSIGVLHPSWSVDALLADESLAERARRDFRAGRLVVVDGWVLSESEVHLCAALHSRGKHSGERPA